MKNKNIYIIGKVVGSYRTQNLIKFLLDQKAYVYYNSFRNNSFKNELGLKSILFFILIRFDILIKKIFSLYNLAISDIVILPAMCNHYQFELKYAKYFKKFIITDFYISLYDSQVLDRTGIDQGSEKALKLKKSDFNCVNKSDYTLFLNKTEANYYLDIIKIPFNPDQHIIVPLCIEESIKCEINYFTESGNDKIFNICWWGTYIPLHGLEKIIEAASILKKNNKSDFHFYLFGTNEVKSKPYFDMVKKLGLENMISIDNQSTFKNGKLGGFLEKKCDLVLGNFGDSEKAKNVIVNKLIDGVAMKAPVLTGESIAPHEFFSEHEIFYSLNNPESIAQNIYYISQLDNITIQEKIERSHAIYKDTFSIHAYRKKLEDLFDKV